MASLSAFERQDTPASTRSPLVRLLAYARPYLVGLGVTLALGLGVSGGHYVRAYLMKPILDDVVLPHAAAAGVEDPSGLIPDFGWLGSGEPAAAPQPPVLAPEQRQALERDIRRSFVNVIGVALIVIFAMPLVHYGRGYLMSYVLRRIHIDLQRDVCAKLLALPLRFHQSRKRGDVLSRTIRDVSVAHGSFDLLFSAVVESILMIAVGGALLFWISWQLALVSMLLAPPLMALIGTLGRRIRASARKRQQSFGEVTQQLLEILSGIKVIKAFRAEAHEDAAFRRQTQHLFRREMKVVKNRVLATSLTEMTNNGMAIGMIVLGAWLVLNGRWGITPGDLAAFGAVLATTYRPVKRLTRGWVRLMDAEPAAERFFELLDVPVEIRDAPDAVTLDGVRRGVRLRDVSFSYGREPVLHDYSLDVAAGETVAIVGRTGAGKTTLADLLLRFHDPGEGRIEIDGVDLRRITRDSLLAHTAVVTQEPFLFDGSIRDNICYGRPEASEAEMRAAARSAHVDEFVDALPKGYETEVGVAGVQLSGGQRQRITIARALLKDPDILIFDEATSSLDSKAEESVQQAIETLFGGRTVFVIAHRLATIRRAHRIVVLENGRVSQLGSHAELMGRDGLYRELVELQILSQEPLAPAGP